MVRFPGTCDIPKAPFSSPDYDLPALRLAQARAVASLAGGAGGERSVVLVPNADLGQVHPLPCPAEHGSVSVKPHALSNHFNVLARDDTDEALHQGAGAGAFSRRHSARVVLMCAQ